jgi:hypothetical protein
LIDALEALLKVHAMREARGTALSDEMAANIVKELKPKHPILAAVIERGHKNGFERDCCRPDSH